MAETILTLKDIRKTFPSPDGERLEILKAINLEIKRGESVAIVGQSGSGKSTLLGISALLLSPDSGEILYEGENALDVRGKELSLLRSKKMGFIFQSSLLLEDFSALENVAMPLMIQGYDKKESFKRAEEYLSLMCLSSRSSHRPALLSGGERQRVAIARALAPNPSMIFADEPTGALDEESAKNVETLLLSAIKEKNLSLLLVTHNLSFARKCDRCLTLKSGVLDE